MPYSLGPWMTTRCRPPKLSKGGGELVDHSSEVASQGFSEAMAPRKRLHNRLNKKISWAAPVRRAAMVMALCPGISGIMKSSRTGGQGAHSPRGPKKARGKKM